MAIPDPIMERQSPDKKLFVAAGSHVTAPLHKWHFILTSGAASSSVTLPNVSEAEGRRFIVTATHASTTGIRRVYYTDGLGTSTLSTTADTSGISIEFISDGIDWTILRTSV